MNVAIFGAGYVGLVTGAVLADIGHRVELVEVDPDKLAQIEAGCPPIYEPGLSQLLRRVVARHSLTATSYPGAAVEAADVIFIAVGTPPLPNGEADLSFVRQAATQIGQHLSGTKRHVVVNKATVPIGCGNLVELWLQDGYSELRGDTLSPDWYAVASNPEFLREGSAIYDTLYPDRIVLGSEDPWAFDRLTALYQPIIDRNFVPPAELPRPPQPRNIPVIRTDRVTAEMIKYAANAFLATKISFANEIANITELVGANISEVAHGIGLDNRIGPRFLNAGIGWGGSCFGKDLSELTAMAEQYGYVPRLLRATVDINRDQRRRIIRHLQQELKTVKGKRIAVWGLSFKPGTDDLRDAPAITIIEELERLGARISAYDPEAMPTLKRVRPDLSILYAATALESTRHCDALVLATEWPEFAGVPLEAIREQMTHPIIIDGRNYLNAEKCRGLGFRYRGIGQD